MDKIFPEIRARFISNANNATNAWQFGRACFDLAELTTNNVTKADLADQGIKACRQALARQPALAPAHYYLGLTLGQFADTKRNMAALKMVKEMERELLAARDLDEHFDFAGPDRNLGILYFESPTVISIGSRSKARQHLQRAVELAPDFPENGLNLIEVFLKWGDHTEARRAINSLEQRWPAVLEKFKADDYTTLRADWQTRLNAAQKKLGGDSK